MNRIIMKAIPAIFMALILGTLYGFAATALVLGGALVLGALHSGELPSGVLRNEVLNQMLLKELQRALLPANNFYDGAVVDAGAAVVKEVVVPQNNGGTAGAVTDPDTFPLSVVETTTDRKSYSISRFATLPERLDNVRELTAAPNLRADLVARHAEKLNDLAAQSILLGWSPTRSERILRTTGADGTSLTAGATGTRKKITADDLMNVWTALASDDVMMDNVRIVAPPRLVKEIMQLPDFVSYEKTGVNSGLVTGEVGMYMGMRVVMRSKTVTYTGAGVAKAMSAVAANSDNLALLVFAPRYVRMGRGAERSYLQTQRGEFLGDIYNAELSAGGIISRTDEKGVIALVQAA